MDATALAVERLLAWHNPDPTDRVVASWDAHPRQGIAEYDAHARRDLDRGHPLP